MIFPISLMILDAFSIVFFETANVEVKRQEITPALVRFFLLSTKWGELGYCQLRMISNTTTELIFSDPPIPQLNEALNYFVRIPKQERFHLAKGKNVPTWKIQEKYLKLKIEIENTVSPEDDVKNKKNKDFDFFEEDNKIFKEFIMAVVFEQRQIIMRDLHKEYNTQLRNDYNLGEELIPGPVPKKRRGGPIPTPDEEKDKMIDEWEKSKGTITIEAFCRKKHIGVSTFGGWRRDRKNRNRPPLT